MTPSEKVKQLEREIEQEKSKIRNCKHMFDKSKYDPEKILEGYGSVQDGAGSDPHWSYAGYREVDKARWSRTCTICGHTQYTYEQAPVITKYEPKFN